MLHNISSRTNNLEKVVVYKFTITTCIDFRCSSKRCICANWETWEKLELTKSYWDKQKNTCAAYIMQHHTVNLFLSYSSFLHSLRNLMRNFLSKLILFQISRLFAFSKTSFTQNFKFFFSQRLALVRIEFSSKLPLKPYVTSLCKNRKTTIFTIK